MFLSSRIARAKRHQKAEAKLKSTKTPRNTIVTPQSTISSTGPFIPDWYNQALSMRITKTDQSAKS